MAKYEIKDVVCDYGLYEDGELKLILNSAKNADTIKRILEIDESVPNVATIADFVEVVRCKKCKWFMPKHVLTDSGERRPYTEEEKKLPLGVTGDKGINCASRCCRYMEWENNSVPVYVQENDFCSYGERRTEND